MEQKQRSIIGAIPVYIILVLTLVFTIFPIIYTVLASFKSNIEILAGSGSLFPQNPTFENYKLVWTSDGFNVSRLLRNSLIYTGFSVFISLMTSSMSGYAFARGKFPGKKVIFMCFTMLMFIKTGGMEIYPKFHILNAINLNKGLIALLILNLFSIPIINIYLVKSFIEAVPKELDEAAKIDGCSFIGIFFKIVMPLLKPILATIAILSFQGSWNDYLLPAIFTTTKPEQRTLIVALVALKNSSGAATNWNLMLAGAVIALFPVLVAYGIGNKYFISGLASGAVKG